MSNLDQTIFYRIISILLHDLPLHAGMRLRLVSREFNEEVLRLYFVIRIKRATLQVQDNPYWARLHIRAFLATNQTFAAQYKPPMHSIRKAIKLLSELPSWIGRWDSPVTRPMTSPLPVDSVGVSSSSVFNDPARAAVSDAVFYQLRDPYDLGGSTVTLLELDSRFWTLAAACVLGDTCLVREAVALQKSPEELESQATECLSRCLYIPALLGHEDTVRLLLELGANVNFTCSTSCSQGLTPLGVAAKAGHKQIVQLLLQPSYGLICKGTKFEHALDAAFRCPEPWTRRQLVQLLLFHGSDLSYLSQRNQLFRSACLHNDITLAQFVLDQGPVNMADAVSQWGRGETALTLAASRGHVQSVQLILHTDFIPAAPDAVEISRLSALCAAVNANSAVVFKELLPYINRERYLEVFTMAAEIDEGETVMTDLLAHIELGTRFQGSTVGESALVHALIHLRPRNVDFLLKHGVRVKRRVRVMRNEYYRRVDAYSIIQDLLRQYDVPEVELTVQ